MTKFFALALVIVLLTPLASLAQGGKTRLTQGIAAYEDLEWQTAVTFLNEALQLGLSDADQIEAYKYLGFSYIDINQPTLAEEAFKTLLTINPDYTLEPNLPPKYIGVFNSAKEAIPQVGSIFVESDPTGAEIQLDNIRRGRTPSTIPDITAGEHSLRLTLGGYQDLLERINVEPGKTTPYQFTLTRTPDQRQTQTPQVQGKSSALPWIIIGGVAAVGGAVAAVVLLSGGDDEGGNGDDIDDVDDEPDTASLGLTVNFPGLP